MLDLLFTSLATEAGALLAQVSDDWGFLPGPGFEPSVHRRLPLPEREAYELRTSYHTTLVHGLLLAATPTRGAPGQPCTAGGTGAAAAAVTGWLQPNERAAAWWTRFASLAPATQDSLASALVKMALRRAVVAADLAAVQATLCLAAEHQVPETPVTRQARVLLRRALTCAELAGAGAGAGA